LAVTQEAKDRRRAFLDEGPRYCVIYFHGIGLDILMVRRRLADS
jgi:hypothetical protein